MANIVMQDKFVLGDESGRVSIGQHGGASNVNVAGRGRRFSQPEWRSLTF